MASNASSSSFGTSEASPPLRSVEELTETNIRTIAQLEAASRGERTLGDRTADSISRFCGSMKFIYFHVVWFAIWITANTTHLAPAALRKDPYPFQFLTLVVSLEAIFLSSFIMISQNRQGLMDQRRNHLDLQINLLAEQESSKTLAMLEQIQQHLGMTDRDPEVIVLEESTRPDALVHQIEEIIERGGPGKKSAVDA